MIKNRFLPIMINTTQNNFFLNQVNWKIPSRGVTGQETINHHDLCYQFSKDGSDFLFGRFGIMDSRDKTHFLAKTKLLSSQIQINMLVKNNDERKRRRCDRNIHKHMGIPVGIYQTNEKLFVTVQPNNECKLEFADILWLPFVVQPQYDIVVFSIITFQIYNILVTKWKHGTVTDDLITFNE